MKTMDHIYYRDGLKAPAAMRALLAAREGMFQLFMDQTRPTKDFKIIDIGASEIENEGANFLEKKYPWPKNITCAGLGHGRQIVSANPAVSFVQIKAGKPLPFNDKQFDIAYSNAVLEHVGDATARGAFISEHMRIARNVFLAFPNRWFPVEHHTGLPLLHYSPGLFRFAIKRTSLREWADPSVVEFLSAKQIFDEWPSSKKPIVYHSGILFPPFSSNVCLVWRED
ncbi:class I SAM-dependent methyltransferase [Bradyrhizobium sp. ORS 86]|uniref:class I SAM-dependent methyltransferase n=1 Tax=Bradyrhizobium sp. ORS 86 TaxID=1685970 RepID=UPI00388EB769